MKFDLIKLPTVVQEQLLKDKGCILQKDTVEIEFYYDNNTIWIINWKGNIK